MIEIKMKKFVANIHEDGCLILKDMENADVRQKSN